jgi:uncharacterized protein (DUF362 family)
MDKRAVVAIEAWTEFDAVGRVLAACLASLGGMESIVSPGQRVVIKPNITADAPASSGGTTHMELVEAIVAEVQRCAPAEIVIAEGTGRFGAALETAFLHGGWREMAARRGATLHNLDAGPHREMSLENPRYPRPLPFSDLVLNADVFISVPCLKTHISADYTVALKNSFSLTPQTQRSKIHREYLIEESLVDLNRIRKPDLVVVDGWDGADGVAGGNKFERPAGARLMIVGRDPVAVDVVSKEIMGLSMRTRYLNWAIADGVGVGDPERIEIRGLSLAEGRSPFMTPAEELVIEMPGLTVHDGNACSGCRVAALSAMRRFVDQKLLKPITVIYGGEGEPAPTTQDTLVVGNCAKAHAALGTHVAGCPAQMDELIAAIEATGCICQTCKHLVEEIVPEIPEELGAHLRITAAGGEVFKGEAVQRGAWHQELLVGECMRRYARMVRERSAQFGLDPERDVIWLTACPPTLEDVRGALAQLHAASVSLGAPMTSERQ